MEKKPVVAQAVFCCPNGHPAAKLPKCRGVCSVCLVIVEGEARACTACRWGVCDHCEHAVKDVGFRKCAKNHRLTTCYYSGILSKARFCDFCTREIHENQGFATCDLCRFTACSMCVCVGNPLEKKKTCCVQ